MMSLFDSNTYKLTYKNFNLSGFHYRMTEEINIKGTLTDDEVILNNIPDIQDVRSLLSILNKQGFNTTFIQFIIPQTFKFFFVIQRETKRKTGIARSTMRRTMAKSQRYIM